MEGEKSWILMSCNRTRQSKDEEIKGSRSSRLASTKKCKKCIEVFEIGKLLQIVCQRFYKSSKTPS